MFKRKPKQESEAAKAAGADATAFDAAAAAIPDLPPTAEETPAAEPVEPEDSALAIELAAKLARFPGPAYRKAYLANLLQSGKRYEAAGNARGAEYCFAKITEGIREAALAAGVDDESDGEDASEDMVQADASNESGVPENGNASQPGADAAESKPRKPRAPGAARSRAKEKPLSPTEIVRRKWRVDRLRDAEDVLNRHGSRLSALEQKAYREKLDKLRESGLKVSSPLQSDKADAGLLDLRRRLYGRVLKSQKLSMKGRHMPVSLARLALPPADRAAWPTVKPAEPAPGSVVRVDPAWQPVVGPYNDRYNMEDLLTLIADADPAWVEEFLDLYRGLSGLQTLMTSIAALKK